MNGYLYTIFAILPFTVSLVWLAVYVADYRTSHKPRRFLTYWALICTVLYLCHGRYFVEDGRVDFIMDCIYLFCNLSVYPLFYCYLLILTKDEPVALRAFLYQIPALIVAVATYLSHGAPLAIHIARVLFALEVIMCAFFGLRTLAQFDKEIKNYYSDTEGKTMTGISVQLVFLVIVAILSFLANLIGRPAFVRSPLIIIPSLAFSCFLFAIFYVCFKVNFYAKDFRKEAQDDIPDESPVLEEEGDDTSLEAKIAAVMDEKKLYLKPGLKISDVAGAVGSNRTYVSNAINNVARMPFADYVNTRRIIYAKKLLSESRSDGDPAITSVASEAGFASFPSFYRAFIKYVGMPPSEWQKGFKS